MPNRQELFNEVVSKLFSLGDKSKEKYNNILDKFSIKSLDQMHEFSEAKLKDILNNINLVTKTGNKKMGKIYTSNDFDSELNGLFFKSAVKLAQEKEEEQKKQEEPKQEEQETEPKQEEPPKQEETNQEFKQEEQKPEETQEDGEEPQKIEDVVKDLQVGILEKMADVKNFKPGRSEAINFRNAVQELIKAGEDAVQKINSYYQKELGGSTQQNEED